MSAPVLTRRQLQVARLVAEGYSNREISVELQVTEQIIKNTIHSLFDRLGVWNRVELARHFSNQWPTDEVQVGLQRMEERRLAELRLRKILDTRSERAFDELAALAAKIFRVPVALVAFMDSGRLWFKSSIGLVTDQVPRELAICNHTIQQSEAFVVNDAINDLCFAGNPLVQELGVRFYAAAPILTEDGYALGVICVLDWVPREFTAADKETLKALAQLALTQVELRTQMLNLQSMDVTVDHKGTATVRRSGKQATLVSPRQE